MTKTQYSPDRTARSFKRLGISVGLFLLAATGLTGCQSAGRPSAGPIGTAAVNPAAVSFRAGDYARAEQLARTAAPQSESSRLILGMSLHQQGETAEAVTQLAPLRMSRDRATRGAALATLGLIAQSNGRHDEAAPMLTQASELLVGTDRVWAAHYASISERALGNTQRADELARVAAPVTSRINAGQIGRAADQFRQQRCQCFQRHLRCLARGHLGHVLLRLL